MCTVCLSMLKCKGQIKSSYSRKPMVVSCQLGQVGWRSTLGTSTFGLLCLFNGHKLPENAIKRPFMAISGSGGSKWLDLSGYWLDLGGIHPGWSDGAIWTHQNCPRGPPGGLEMAQKCHKMRIYGHKWLRWVQMAPTDHPGCIPPRSNQDPLRSSHFEPTEPLIAINVRFMAFLGHF